jgi:hypothetical protein
VDDGMIRLDYTLYVCFFLAGFAHQLLYVLFPALALTSVLRHSFQYHHTQVARLFFQFFLFVFFLFFIGTILSHNVSQFSFKGVMRYFAYYCFAVFLSYFPSSSIELMVRRISQTFILLLPYAIFETLTKERYVLVFQHSNNLAYVLVILLLFHLGDTSKWKWGYVLGLAFSILLTKSSGASFVMILLVLVHIFVFEKIPLPNKIITFVAVFSMILLGFSLFPERVLEQWDSFSQINWEQMKYRALKHRFGSHGSGVWRITYWIAILDEFFKSPLRTIIFGLGLDTMTVGNYAYSFMNRDPHNDYVKLITEFGILGVLFFVYFLVQVAKITGRKFLWVVALLLPMYFGNILVNFPFIILYIAFLSCLEKDFKGEQAIGGLAGTSAL